MATISFDTNAPQTVGTAYMTRGALYAPYVSYQVVDFAEAAVKKGSALAASDVIETIEVPAGSHVTMAGFKVLEAMTGTSTDATLDFGITGDNVDEYVDGFDLDGASAGDWATPASTVYDGTFFSARGTLDLLIATQTGTVTGGKLLCYAVIVPVDATNQVSAGIAKIGS